MRSRSEFEPVDPKLDMLFRLILGVRLGGAATVEFAGGVMTPLTDELVVE